MSITLTINGAKHNIDVEADTPLLYVLRGELKLNGAKFGCGLGQCGACTVLADGAPIRSCSVAVSDLGDAKIVTLEGLPKNGKLHPVQQAFLDEQTGQCAYCIPGFIMGAVGLLAATPRPTDDQIKTALDRNLCRCGSHNRILRAVKRAAGITG